MNDDLNTWEDNLPWMYLDSKGLVTVGYGTMLPDADAAASIDFVHAGNKAAATPAEVRAAYKAVASGAAAQKDASGHKKFSARHYEGASDLRITQRTAERLRENHVNQDYEQLRRIYRNFDDFPDNAKIALFDMIYNLGGGHGKSRHHRASGLRRYGAMNAAIGKADWGVAAKTCRRHGIPAARNAQTRQLFESCVRAPAKTSP